MHRLLALARRLRIPAAVCPSCDSVFGRPLCGLCRSASGIGATPFRSKLGSHDVLFVGAYHAAAHLEGHRALTPLGSSLRSFKDRGDRYAGRCLASLFASNCAPAVRDFDVLVPVPSDPSRLRRRGLGPAAWLAGALAKRSGVRLAMSALVRVQGERPAQRRLGGAARRANMRGAFELGAAPIRGYSIVLVDDVLTTGATLREAAHPLVAAGAARIVCAVLACADEKLLLETASHGRPASKEDGE